MTRTNKEKQAKPEQTECKNTLMQERITGKTLQSDPCELDVFVLLNQIRLNSGESDRVPDSLCADVDCVNGLEAEFRLRAD